VCVALLFGGMLPVRGDLDFTEGLWEFLKREEVMLFVCFGMILDVIIVCEYGCVWVCLGVF